MTTGIVFSRLGRIYLSLVLIPVLIFGFHPGGPQSFPHKKGPQEDADSIIWHEAVRFTTIFNKGDTQAMNQFLPDDFMLQLLHENFFGKKSLFNIMRDTAVHASFMHLLHQDVNTIIRLSDDNHAASVNTAIEFTDTTMAESVKKEHGYGLSIMYFQKINDRWWLKTVHLDLHCSLCNE